MRVPAQEARPVSPIAPQLSTWRPHLVHGESCHVYVSILSFALQKQIYFRITNAAGSPNIRNPTRPVHLLGFLLG